MKYRVFGVVMTIFMGIAMGAFTLATPEDSNQRVFISTLYPVGQMRAAVAAARSSAPICR